MPTITSRSADQAAQDALRKAGYPPLLARLLAARGIDAADQLWTRLAQVLPFAGMRNIDVAGRRLAEAILRKERVLVVGDFDCDGATSTAVAVEGLQLLGAEAGDVDFLVPHRTRHGYGLSPALVAEAALHKPSLIVTVDNGIAALAGVKAAQDLGIDVVVTDHHLPGDETPNCIVVDPNQRGCPHPGKNLAGVGVMFYVIAAVKAELAARGRLPAGGADLSTLLDLVALGTVADVVRLDPNNRLLVLHGLQRIRKGATRPGILALFQIARKNPMLATAEDFGFALGPRLNAAGRLDDMTWGIRCLLAKSETEALHYASELDRMNHERKEIEVAMKDEAMGDLSQVLQAGALGHTVVLLDPSWHPGVVGLLASRIKDMHNRPTLIFTEGGPGLVKGSGRSIPGFHLRDALDLVDKRTGHRAISKFGGHAMAAGLTVNAAEFATLQREFEAVAREWLPPGFENQVIETDGELDPAFCTVEDLTAVRDTVWGQGFPAPSFVGEFEVMNQRILKDAHSKLELWGSGLALPALLFNHVDALPRKITAVYRPVLNTFRGETAIEAIIERVL